MSGMWVDKTRFDHFGDTISPAHKALSLWLTRTIDEARQELHRIILDREMKEALLLVFANKQDIPGSMTPTEVTEKLRLGQLKERIWYVVPSCATTGEGLLEGLVSGIKCSKSRTEN